MLIQNEKTKQKNITGSVLQVSTCMYSRNKINLTMTIYQYLVQQADIAEHKNLITSPIFFSCINTVVSIVCSQNRRKTDKTTKKRLEKLHTRA